MHCLPLVSPEQALSEIPDTPATLECRAVALDARGAVYRSGDGLLVADARHHLVGALGAVVVRDVETLIEGMETDYELLADLAAHRILQSAYPFERAIIHTLAKPWRPRDSRIGDLVIRPLAASDSLDHLPDELRHQIERELPLGIVFAGFIDSAAVSFAYSASGTETYSDISIDTLEPHRNRGIGATVVSVLIDHIVAEGRQPVWGAVVDNRASLRLAEKLGFTKPAGELFVVEEVGSS